MKRKIYLQLFANEPEGIETPEVDATEENPGKPKDEKKYSDKDLDEIIGRKFAKWKAEEEKKVNEAKRLAEMNATQKAEYERDALKKELDEYKRKDTLAQMTVTARNMLKESNIFVGDEILARLVSDDADQTKVAVEGFAKAFKDEVDKAVKERIKGEPPRKGSGTPNTLTKEQIMAISDPELRQQRMLENRELFNF